LPVLPLAAAAIASVLPAADTIGLPIQGFVATHETWLYAIGITLMLCGRCGNARRALHSAG
jgi:hypothetical protein